MRLRIEPVSETTLMIYLGECIDPGLASAIGELSGRLRQQLGRRLLEVVPSYTSILVEYDPLRCDVERLRAQISALAEQIDANIPQQPGRLIELPVYYHPEVAPDLEPLAGRLGISIDNLIARHSDPEYRVFAIGFAPGFAFLGEVDEQIACPRHATPRARVMAGSVGIADRQTGVYPADLPGGWQIIGNSPYPLYHPGHSPATPFSVGDRVRFRPIDRECYRRAGGQPWHG